MISGCFCEIVHFCGKITSHCVARDRAVNGTAINIRHAYVCARSFYIITAGRTVIIRMNALR